MLRHKGCGFSFVRERDSIMKVAKGEDWQQNQHYRMNTRIPQEMLLESNMLPTQRDLEETLHKVSHNLDNSEQSPQTTLFVLQNLIALTSSNEQLVAENTHRLPLLIMENRDQIRDRIQSIFMAQIPSSDYDDETRQQIHNASLVILTNCLHSMYKQNEKTKYFNCEEESYKLFVQKLVPKLVETVVNHSQSPSNACLSMTCLKVLLLHSATARTMLYEMNELGRIVEQAKLYGCREHLKLEQIATSLLELL